MKRICHESQVGEVGMVVTAKERAGGSGRPEAGEAQNEKRVGIGSAVNAAVSAAETPRPAK